MKTTKDDTAFADASASREARAKLIRRLYHHRMMFYIVAGIHLGVICLDLAQRLMPDTRGVPAHPVVVFNAALFLALALHADVKLKILLALDRREQNSK